jgi:methylthioribose-1-phosphate isomerase
MSETPKIIEDFLKGNNDAGGTIASLEEEAKRLASQIETLENTRDTAWNAALEWAASWITGAGLIGKSEEIQEYARTMAMSIRAAQVGLTQRVPDVCPSCAGEKQVIGEDGTVWVCGICGGTGKRR